MKSKILALAAVMIISSSGVAYADVSTTTPPAKPTQTDGGNGSGEGEKMRNGKMGGRMSEDLAIASGLLGITEDALNTALAAEGTTLYSLLETAGVVDTYKTSVIAAKTVELNQMVTAGTMTQTEAAEMIARITEQITSWDGTDKERRMGGNMVDYAIAAALLGITEDVLTAKVEAGSNLYTLLTDAAKLDSYKAQLLAKETARINEMVTAGTLDTAEAAEKIAQLQEMLNAWDGTVKEMGGMKGEKPTGEPPAGRTAVKTTEV